jgi:hypothetical protein
MVAVSLETSLVSYVVIRNTSNTFDVSSKHITHIGYKKYVFGTLDITSNVCERVSSIV